MDLTDDQKKLLEIANLSIDDLPKTHTELCNIVWHAFDSGRYFPHNCNMPNVQLICSECGAQAKAIAHDTGDGWYLGLECDCQKYIDKFYFELEIPGKTTINGKELELLGFETV